MKNKKKKQPTKKQKVIKNGYDKTLEEIYKDEKGDIPDMSKLYHSKKGFFKKILVFILTLSLISVTAWAGFILYSGQNTFSSKNVSMKIKAPFNILSGENIEYNIYIKNNESLEIQNNELTVKFPNGFIFKDANYNLQQSETSTGKSIQNIYTTKLPNISPNSNIEIIIKGQMVGELGFLPTISANLKYSPAEISSEFEINTSFDSEISDSLIQLTTDYKNQLVNETNARINFNIKNLNKISPIENLKIEIDAPENFTDKLILSKSSNPIYKTEETLDQPVEEIQKSDKEYIELDNVNKDRFKSENNFLIDGIAPETELNYQLTGKFNVDKNAKETITIRVYTKDAKNDYNLQTEELMEFQVVNGELLNTIIINGSEQNQAINFGDSLTYLLTVQNKSKSALSNVKVRAVIDSQILDWDTLKDDNDGKVVKNQILWTDKEISKLALMLPEDEVQISFKINTKDYEKVKKLKSESFKITSYFETTINQIDGVDVVKTSTSNSVINTFNSNLQLTTNGVYFDNNGQAIGSGPIPPKVGEKTTYQIDVEVNNSINELKNISFTATLPENVTWEYDNNVDAGNLNYNDKKITWTINRIPTSIQSVKGSFKISITPETKDANKILTLLQDIKIEATDTVSEDTIALDNPPITTNISTDSSGLVQEK